MRKLLVFGLVLLAGCGGNSSESVPVGCTEGPGPVVKALRKAPGAVTVDGTPISRCFNRNAHGQDVEIVGTNLVTAAQELGDRARQGEPAAALQLGYLVGAAQRGSKRSGLATEMVRRIEAESSGVRAARPAYERGLRAGLAQG